MSAVAEPSKYARLDLRLPKDTRALIVEAAALSGASLTDYVLTSSFLAARRDVPESWTIRLSREAWNDFLDILDRPDNANLAALREHAVVGDVPAVRPGKPRPIRPKYPLAAFNSGSEDLNAWLASRTVRNERRGDPRTYAIRTARTTSAAKISWTVAWT